MGEFRLPLRSDYERNAGEKWDTCHLCGSLHKQAILHFKQGTVTPTEHETITGASSGDTGTLDKYVLVSGTFAAGTAAGIFILTSPSGYDENNLEVFTKDENLNGSTSGNAFAVATNKGAVEISGRMIPDGDLITYRGKKYCKPHFRFAHAKEWEDEADISRGEGDRE